MQSDARPVVSDDAGSDLRLQRARQGDHHAFTALLREHDDAMRALVWSMTRDAWLMDDILQVAYEKAYRNLVKFRGDASFKTWLHRICWTTAIDTLKVQQRHSASPIGEDVERMPVQTAGPEERSVDRLSFEQAWKALVPDQRSALALVLLEGYSYDQAAAICGTRPGTIAARVSRGRTRLAELLGSVDNPRATDRQGGQEWTTRS